MAATFRRVLEYDGLNIQGRDVRVTVEIKKILSDDGDPIVAIQVAFPALNTRASMPSVSIHHEELHELFDMIEQSERLSAKLAVERGFSHRESSVSIGDFKVSENGLTWGDLGLVTPPEDSMHLLTKLKDLAQSAAELPIPIKRD